MEAVRQESRVAWTLLHNASVLSLEDGVLTLRFPSVGEMRGFSVSGHDAVLKRVLSAEFGLNVTVRGVTGADAAAGEGKSAGPAGPDPGQAQGASGAASRPAPVTPPGPAGPVGSGPARSAPARVRPRFDEPPPDEIPDDIPPDEPGSGQAPGVTELTGMDLIRRELGGQVIGEIEG